MSSRICKYLIPLFLPLAAWGQAAFTQMSGSPFTGSNYPIASVIGDFDGDGTKDFVVIEQNPMLQDLIRFYKGPAFTTTSTAVCYVSANGCTSMVAGDFDRNGTLDLAVGMSTGIQIFNNDGTGQFSAGNFYATSSSINAILALDVDGDGILDLAYTRDDVYMSAAGTFAVRKGTGTGAFGNEVPITTTTTFPRNPIAVDLNGDGKLDIVVTEADSI